MNTHKILSIFLVFINYLCFSQNPKYYISDYGWENLQHGSKQSVENVSVPFSALYPNPSREVAYLEYNLPHEKTGMLQIFDTNGQLLMSRSMSSKGKLSIPLHDLSSGMYFYRLSINDEVFGRDKLIIVH